MTDLKHTDSAFSIQSCRICYATQHLCQRSFYKIFVKFRNSKKNVLKMVLIIVNINKDENKSLISYQFSLQNDSPLPHFLENYSAEVKIKNCGYHVYTIVAIMFTPLWLSCLHHLVYLFPSIFCTFKYVFIILYWIRASTKSYCLHFLWDVLKGFFCEFFFSFFFSVNLDSGRINCNDGDGVKHISSIP